MRLSVLLISKMEEIITMLCSYQDKLNLIITIWLKKRHLQKEELKATLHGNDIEDRPEEGIL
jgi:hypothetical protein